MEEEIVEEVIEEQPPRPVGTFYLKFEDEDAFLAACEEADLTREDEEGNKHVVFHSHHHALDAIGIMYTPGVFETDTTTGEIVVTEEPVALQGFHVNYSGVLPLSFETSLIERPVTPYRTFGV